jgi:hypothetical protein
MNNPIITDNRAKKKTLVDVLDLERYPAPEQEEFRRPQAKERLEKVLGKYKKV